jgi:hypothetical protein
MQRNCELSTRTSVRAYYAAGNLLLVAQGELPTPGYEVDIEQSPVRTFPPQYNLRRCPLPGVWPDVVTPFTHSESFHIGGTQPEQVTVHHAEGTDQVPIEECGPELAPYAAAFGGGAERTCPEGADEATGFSKDLSFDQAFAAALAQLPPVEPTHPDQMETVRVLEIGAFFGGIAGFNDLWVRICRTYQ